MCGITGLMALDGRPIEEAELVRFTTRVAHRGPDGSGTFVDGPVGLGHRRLAIIDPDGGHQPLANEDGTIHVTYNGEIYNFRELRRQLEGAGHRFRTRCDTEVLVHAYEEWGDDLVDRLRGMFAFGIWDSRRQRLLLARDRIGIKPLCWATDGRRFAFASEIQAFAALEGFRRTLDLEAIDLFLHKQHIPAPLTAFREVRKLPPGHTLVVDRERGVGEPRRYWRMRFDPLHGRSEAEWIECLDEALREAVRAQLVSDVPFGAFLSGGVDSSSVVAYMAEILDEPVRTFTMGHRGGEGEDETGWAAEVAASLGTVHHERRLGGEAMDVLPDLVRYYGEPFADSSAVATWHVSALAREHVKMVLSGDGGDELFGGYERYGKMMAAHPEPGGPVRRMRRRAGNLARSLGLYPPLPVPADTWYDLGYFPEAARRSVWRPEYEHVLHRTRTRNRQRFAPWAAMDVLSQSQMADLEGFLPHDNLVKVDVASMAHGLEVRVPLLDDRLVELAARIPPHLRMRIVREANGTPREAVGKYLLRRTTGRFFRPGFFDRTKVGFSIPVDEWLRDVPESRLKDRLAGRGSPLTELFEPAGLMQMVEDHHDGRPYGWRLWSLACLAEWMDQVRSETAMAVG